MIRGYGRDGADGGDERAEQAEMRALLVERRVDRLMAGQTLPDPLRNHTRATLIALADDTSGQGLRPNAASDTEVKPGAVLYYIAVTSGSSGTPTTILTGTY